MPGWIENCISAELTAMHSGRAAKMKTARSATCQPCSARKAARAPGSVSDGPAAATRSTSQDTAQETPTSAQASATLAATAAKNTPKAPCSAQRQKGRKSRGGDPAAGAFGSKRPAARRVRAVSMGRQNRSRTAPVERRTACR